MYYPHCTIKGYLNDKGQLANMDGVLLTMEEPIKIDVEPGDFPEMEFTPYVEVIDIPELKIEKPEVQIQQRDIPKMEIEKPVVKIQKKEIPLLQIQQSEVRLRRILGQLRQEAKTIELDKVVNSLPHEERKIDFETFQGVLRENERTVELAEVLGQLPEKEQIVLMEVLNELLPAGFASEEDFADFADVEVDETDEEILQNLFLKYGY